MIYVTAIDRYMSGWGGEARNAINKIAVACENLKEAKEVEEALHKRSEMKYIGIRYTKPCYKRGYVISWYRYCKNATYKFNI